MKKNFLALLLTTVFLLSFTLPTHAETFTLDPNHTYVLWHIKHFGFSTQAGKWYATGTLVLDKDKPQNDKLDVTIQVANIATGLPELDKHLKGKLFFDTEQFPTATFVSNKVQSTSKSSAKVYGNLTVRGVTKPVVLEVKLNKVGINPISNKMTAGFSAKTMIKRSEFGITTLLPSLSDDVTLEIEAEAFKSTN